MSRKNQEIYKQVSEEMGIPYEVVKKIHYAAWDFTRSTIRNMSIDIENITEEEHAAMKTSFYFSGLGKLYLPYDKILRRRRRVKWLKENLGDEFKKDKANV